VLFLLTLGCNDLIPQIPQIPVPTGQPQPGPTDAPTDTAPPADDTCAPLLDGPDRFVSRLLHEGDNLAGCTVPDDLAQMVRSEAEYQALFTCPPGTDPPPSLTDFVANDLWVAWDLAWNLTTPEGIHDAPDGTVRVVRESACLPDPPPPPFRDLELLRVPKGLEVDGVTFCRRTPCP
jgi:hypothetical protein